MNRKNLKVLIVDDDESLREIYRLCLEMEGFKIREAPNGAEALEYLLSESLEGLPDCIILDLMMPVMDGNTFLERIHAGQAHELKLIPVIVCSALGQIPPAEFFSKMIMKPVSIDELTKAVVALTGNARLEEGKFQRSGGIPG